MIPNFCPSNAPPGEKLIFGRLQNDPGAADWIVLHSLDLAKHPTQVSGEADFVILIPGEGILVIEVKSHQHIVYSESGWWLGSDYDTAERGPIKQAGNAMQAIREYLEAKQLNRNVPMGHCAWFTHCPFKQESPEWHTWQTLDKQDVTARSVSETCLQVIRKEKAHLAASGLRWIRGATFSEPAKIKLIASCLRPQFEFIVSASSRRNSLEESLLAATTRQHHVLDRLSRNQRIILSGLAGTGKTTLAMEAARRERSQTPGSLVMIFCYNRLLGEELAEQTAQTIPGVKAGTMHQWLLKMTGYSLSKSEDIDPSFWDQQLPSKVLDILTEPSNKGGLIDYLIIDEAQDLLTEEYLLVFDALLKGGLERGRWLITGDFERQNINLRNRGSLANLLSIYPNIAYADIIIDENCRNSREISEFYSLLSKLSPGYSSNLRPDTHLDPELHFFEKPEEQYKALEKELQRLKEAGYKSHEIVILSPYKKSAASKLSESAVWKGRLNPFKHTHKSTRYCTIQSYKGLESPAIIITDIHELSESEATDLFYVGMSRALHSLTVFCHLSTKESIRKALLK